MKNYDIVNGRIVRKKTETVTVEAPVTGLAHLAEDLPALHELVSRLLQSKVRFKLETPGSRKGLDRYRITVFTENGKVQVEAHQPNLVSRDFASKLDGVEKADVTIDDFQEQTYSEENDKTVADIVEEARADVDYMGEGFKLGHPDYGDEFGGRR
jgi:hypothetical protein